MLPYYTVKKTICVRLFCIKKDFNCRTREYQSTLRGGRTNLENLEISTDLVKDYKTPRALFAHRYYGLLLSVVFWPRKLS